MVEIKILKKHIDTRKRVVLPINSQIESIFLINLGDIFILGKSESELRKFMDNYSQVKNEKKISSIESWFELIEEAGLSEFMKEEIREKHISIIKNRIQDLHE